MGAYLPLSQASMYLRFGKVVFERVGMGASGPGASSRSAPIISAKGGSAQQGEDATMAQPF